MGSARSESARSESTRSGCTRWAVRDRGVQDRQYEIVQHGIGKQERRSRRNGQCETGENEIGHGRSGSGRTGRQYELGRCGVEQCTNADRARFHRGKGSDVSRRRRGGHRDEAQGEEVACEGLGRAPRIGAEGATLWGRGGGVLRPRHSGCVGSRGSRRLRGLLAHRSRPR
jgi:hypothetical protein